jgi:hypothetical protein
MIFFFRGLVSAPLLCTLPSSTLFAVSPEHLIRFETMYLTPSDAKYTRPEDIAMARKLLWATWGDVQPRRGEMGSPAPQPVSLHKHELDWIAGSPDAYCTSLKADGVRYLLLLTVDNSGPTTEFVALMFDRRLIPYEISLRAPAHFFEAGSLFDGELLQWDDGGLRFLVFDVFSVAGEPVGQIADYRKRINVARGIFDVGSAYDDMTSPLADELVLKNSHVVVIGHDRALRMQTKPVVPVNELRELWVERQGVGFAHDGLVFTRIEAPVRLGRNAEQFKWKATHTVDVLLRGGVDDTSVYSLHGARSILMSRKPVVKVKGADRAVCTVVHNLVTNRLDWSVGHIVECTMELAEDGTLRLFPVMTREDKSAPNQLTTIESTLENVLEHIDIEDLLDQLCPDGLGF